MVINPIVYDENRGNDIFSKNLENRVIHLVGEINDEMSASIVGQLLFLSEQGNEDIQLYINSPGGSVTAGMAIYDTMQYITPDVATVCVGRAASMGAVLLSGGAKGKRVILPHAEVMIHQPSGGMEGQATELEIAAEHIGQTKKMLNTILAENCNKKLDAVKKDTDRDRWMVAQEALDYGIVDTILSKPEGGSK
ncbi:MAG: ATP-dependent Clp protease proteolytic subunit [Lachnospiraceae bacterium]|nr:ATP-dependent Clp protease proteolytic subunit [Lachnospiraceae bacterium]